ncbi:hypothetical protein GCM10018773_14430 [Streptomyces candidus]|nr:hypothetical protein GCM10018773_14430 [Streptomyces candidus]
MTRGAGAAVLTGQVSQTRGASPNERRDEARAGSFLLRGSARRFTDRRLRAAQWDAPDGAAFRPHEYGMEW